MPPGAKTEMPDGIVLGRPDQMSYHETSIYGTVLHRSPLFEGDHGVRSAFVKMRQGDVIKNHQHRKWVQVAVMNGTLEVAQRGTVFVAKAGDAYFLDPGHPHVETALEDSLVLVTQGEDRPDWLDK